MKNNNIYDGYLDWKNWRGNFGILDDSTKRYYDLELKKVVRNFQDSKIRVLEIGFGNGSFLKYALNQGWDICGIEINSDLSILAKNKGFQVFESMEELDDSTFDLIVAFDVLEHIPSDEVVGFINLIKSKLKLGGFFLARFPNGDSPIGLKNQNGDLTHKNMIGSEKIVQISKITCMDIYSLNGATELIVMETLKKTIHRLCVYPIKKIINIFFKLIYFPTSIYFFSSENLVVSFKKEKNNE